MKNKVFALFIISLFVFIIGGCDLASKTNYISDIEVVNNLYELKDTYIGDASKVRSIIDLVNSTEYKVENIELKTDVEPFRLTVNFAVDSRANYRFVDENGLNRMSAFIFALVKNADEILYCFYDDYADRGNIENAYSSFYYTKQNLCERISSGKITPEYIQKSTDTIKTFEEYYKTVVTVEAAEPYKEFLNAVYEFIGDDWEIVVNSSIGADVELDEYNGSDFAVISDNLSNEIGKYHGAGIKAQLVTYDIRNFKTNEYGKCMFMFYMHPDEGLVMITSEFIDDERFEDIKEFVIKNQK